MTRWVPTKKEKYGVGECLRVFVPSDVEKVGKFPCWNEAAAELQFPELWRLFAAFCWEMRSLIRRDFALHRVGAFSSLGTLPEL